ncbi:MAG: hypothetical protein CBD95_002485 [Flavobacteriales bacterium TMED235]|jgi:hypothetical protein|nr:MAG: hypothetical protein CBD95_002485 [Flavobacteriales bacterium TMED235]|tara:strand:+ start:3914 stop:4132 length:219 start_codon:yes stop_codon:yes gene_type:complete
MKDLNKEFADIVWNSLEDVDELGDDILLESDLFEPRLFHNRLPTIDLPNGYLIISQTFIFEDEEEEDGNKNQ